MRSLPSKVEDQTRPCTFSGITRSTRMPSRDMAALGELPEGSPGVGRQAQEYLGYAQSYSLSELLATGRPPNLRRWLDDEKDCLSSNLRQGQRRSGMTAPVRYLLPARCFAKGIRGGL